MKYFNSLSGGSEGAEYKGMWLAGKRHGKGELMWGDGSLFEGLWNADSRVFGIMRFSNNQVKI